LACLILYGAQRPRSRPFVGNGRVQPLTTYRQEAYRGAFTLSHVSREQQVLAPIKDTRIRKSMVRGLGSL